MMIIMTPLNSTMSRKRDQLVLNRQKVSAAIEALEEKESIAGSVSEAGSANEVPLDLGEITILLLAGKEVRPEEVIKGEVDVDKAKAFIAVCNH